MFFHSIISKPLNFVLGTSLLFSGFVASQVAVGSDFKAEAKAIANAAYVHAPSELLAKKLMISYHHKLLETDEQTGAMVMQLSDEDWAKLSELGFVLAPADKWIEKRRSQLSQLEKKFEGSKGQVSNDSITGFACYSTVEGTFARAEQLANEHPLFARWVDIGDSWSKAQQQSGFDIKVLQITNQATDQTADGQSVDKPILFIHSAMHARELATAELTTRFAEHLLNNRDSDADIRWILDAHQVHIVFHMNPDGRKKAESGLYWRKNVNSNYCPTDSRYIGADLNRNFSFFWGGVSSGSLLDQCSEVYRGLVAGSEPETQAIEEYIRSIFADSRGSNDNDAAPDDTHGMHIDVHSYGELVLWPWGHTYSDAPNGDALQTLGRKLAKFNGYSPMQSVGLYPTEGTSDDVSYGELGVAAITLELGNSFFESCSNFEQKVLPDNIEALMYAAKTVRAPYLLPSGPEVIELLVNGEQQATVEQGELINILASVSDNYFSVRGGVEDTQTVAAAKLYINELPWHQGATGISMMPVDGTAGEVEEQMSTIIDTQDLPLGRHTIYVHGQDSNGQWGVVKALDFDLVEEGEEPENIPPEASFAVQCSGLICQFDGVQSSDEDGSIIEFGWQLGDGSNEVSSPLATYEHRYLPGVYTIELTVTDNMGGQGVASEELTVNNLPPVASFTVSCDGGSCNFDGSLSVDSDGTIESYLWQVDGQSLSETQSTARYTFSESGSFEVSLTVSDDVNDVTVATETVFVTLSAIEPVPMPTVPDSSGGGGNMGWLSLLYLGLLRLRGKGSAH